MDVLDNAVWHSLQGPHERFAERLGGACRFEPAVAPFAALPDRPSVEDWADLAHLVGAGSLAVLFRPFLDAPGGWKLHTQFRGMQMVHGRAGDVGPADADDPGRADILGHADVADMMRLVARTEPGPFASRTVELGRYIGVHREQELIAMAGERLRLPGFVEISAVCTDPAHRGGGLAASLVRDLVAHIRSAGAVPILHVVESNVGAIRLYESLGFAVRRPIDGMILETPASVR